MRHGRAKAARKTLQFFARTIGLKAPYSILLDGTFVAAMFQQKILPFKERMDRVLQTTGAAGTNRYCITQEAVDELKQIYQELESRNHEKVTAFRQALDWIRKECIVLKQEPQDSTENVDDEGSRNPNEPQSTPAQNAFRQSVKHQEEKPYIVASQDEVLLNELRIRGIFPIARLANQSVLILEHPSKYSQTQSKGKERKKWQHGLVEAEKSLVDLVRQEKRKTKISSSSSSSPRPPTRQRVRKAKGPNPLSCKRKQGTGDGSGKGSNSKKRRDRAKKQRVKEA